MVAAYVFLFYTSQLFFKNSITSKLHNKSVHSIIYIVVLDALAYWLSLNISDIQLSNRVLHAFGGGFLAFFVCFRVAKDAKLPVNKFQFFVASSLIVISLGVANEIIEFFLQNYSNLHIVFAPTINDTWLDLVSNTVGAFIASVCFVPFIKSAKNV